MENNCDTCDRSFEVVSLRRMVVGNGKARRYCSDCCSGATAATPDVYYGYGSGTHSEENIADPKTGKPIPFSSRREKAWAMKQAGVQELGDRIHGSRRASDMHPSQRKKYFL